ncbi:MAG: YitT family protein [Firmicutes bacterium]|nr:YitT family protein [Bacillota bacterium]
MNTRQIIFRGITFVLGVFLLAICYNVFLMPNNLVVGGMSGLAIVFHEIFKWSDTIFIYASSIILLIISFIFLGKETTSNTVIGSLLYPLMITMTSPIANCLIEIMDVEEKIVIVALAGLLYGVAHGLIYKMGFTTGGGDVIMQLLSKYAKISTARANFMYNIIIILLSGLVFGMSSMIYAVIILAVSNILIDKIIVGISNSKVFFICTQKPKEIKAIIRDEYDSGFTILPTKSSYSNKKNELIMIVVPNRVYHAFKNRVLEVDPQAFFLINDCYEVEGGQRKSNLPFFEI